MQRLLKGTRKTQGRHAKAVVGGGKKKYAPVLSEPERAPRYVHDEGSRKERDEQNRANETERNTFSSY